MQFSSILFLWIFLPIVFILYLVVDRKYKNLLLTISSLIFYAWGGVLYSLIIIFSIVVNFEFAIFIECVKQKIILKKILFIFCIIINLSTLLYFKYANFFVEILNSAVHTKVFSIKYIILPVGISFYTFQAISYIVDVYSGKQVAQKNILNLALYISFFPQLIAGPIVKYRDIASQITLRESTNDKIAIGIKKFIYGLGKKVILANSFAFSVDNIFAKSTDELSSVLVWVAMLLYALQIYYDFSGYSDMAIGLGKMFGFDFLENFNYPYTALSLQDFWQRWHISLSTWFKEYLYIPLGGNRLGNIRTYFNILMVFFVTGIWHGASYNFIVWGIFHGFFLILERIFLGKLLKRNKFKIVNHFYTISVVLISWVLFRATNLTHALEIFKIMFGMSKSYLTVRQFVGPQVMLLAVIGVVFSGILKNRFDNLKKRLFQEKISLGEFTLQLLIMFISIMLLINNTYNPFIYFRF